MHGFMFKLCPAVIAALLLAGAAVAQDKGVIDDPDGFTHLRAKPDATAEEVAKVPKDEVFGFERVHKSDWWKVTLASGKTGWMHASRIRFHYSFDDIPPKDEEGAEVTYLGESNGFDYCVTARAAAKGEAKALKAFFGIDNADGGAAEGHASYIDLVMHLLGDEKLAAFLKEQPMKFRNEVRNNMGSGMVMWSDHEGTSYAERVFPRTYKLLCPKEITDWPSPDGRYAIHKVFNEARVSEKSKVVKAELVEKDSGKAVLDLTKHDVGTVVFREGSVSWSPDSNRFAYHSGTHGAGASQTVVFQKSGDKFTAVELPEAELPDRAGDKELEGMRLMWRIVEPIRWEKPDVLVLLQHEYFEGKHPDRSIRSEGRTYEVTQDLTKGTAKAKVKTYE
jgi:hypothetical protein